MDRLHLSQHISRRFGSEIEDLRREVLAMGGLVEEQVDAARSALARGAAIDAREIDARERRINAAELAIDEQCVLVIARRQPAASDLRLVLAILKMLNELERIGDEAKRIARIGERLVGQPSAPDVEAGMQALGTLALAMLHDALDAFVRLDEAPALATMHRDAEADAAWRRLQAMLVERMREVPDTIPAELDRLWCARSFERIGDHCKNLCESVLYILHGKDVRHSGLAKPPRA